MDSAVCRVTMLLHTGRCMQVSMTEAEAAGAAWQALGVKQLLPPPSLGKAAAGTGTGRPRSAVSTAEELQELVPKVCCRMLPRRWFPSYAAAYCRQGGAQSGLLYTAPKPCVQDYIQWLCPVAPQVYFKASAHLLGAA